jgi:PAS domain S-box-containing protein
MMPGRSSKQLPYFGPLLDHLEDAVVGADSDWRITIWNRGAEQMYGWSEREALGQHASSFLRVDLSEERRAEVRREVAERGRWRGEATVERSDGSSVSVEVINVAIRDEDGEITGYLGIHRDITERKQVEQALRKANRRSETILDSIGDTFFAVDASWRYTYLNELAVAKAQKAWGREVSVEELLGRDCWELFPESVGTTLDRELHRAMRERRVVEFEAYSVPTETWVELRAHPSGEGLSVYSRDITVRKRGREHLAYYASLLENVEDGVIATDAEDFRLTAWNKGAEQLYGFTAEEVLGRPAREVASYPSDEARLRLERELSETGRTRIEFTAHRKDGSPVEVELIAVAVKVEQGETSGYLGIHRDITARKRDEDALREANARIVSIIESSTDEFVAFDEQWGYTYLNGGAVKAINDALGTELTREDVMGKTVWDLFPSFADTALYAKLDQGRREGRAVCAEAYWEPDDRWVEVRAFPWNGGLAAYTRDITERRRVEERLEEAREAERSRIARALHDEALQALTDALVLAIAARSASTKPGPLSKLVTVLQRVGEQLRGAIYDLRIGVEKDKPFPELLGELVVVHREMAVGSEIELTLGEGVPSGSLGAPGVEVLRIVGEALTNARRHANARHIRVRVWGTEGRLNAEVSDDGRGFDVTSPASAVHRGIEGMRERAEQVGGQLEIESEPGVGTSVRLGASVTNGTSGRA